MNTTNRPAKPLPWIVNQRHLVITAKDFHGVANFREDRDAAYAVHAINAYPELVKALRNTLNDRSTHLSKEQIDAILNLLRELGEEE